MAGVGRSILEFDSSRVRLVGSFEELVGARFQGDVNALCWPRELEGDFQEIVARLPADEGITPVEAKDLRALALTPAGAIAREALLRDQALLGEHGLAPSLDLIRGYARDVAEGPVATDVYSFHVDSAPVEADTFLCTYTGATSEGLPNEMAVRRIDMAETRAGLLRDYGGADDGGFAAYLAERCFDLHYAPLPHARPYPFGLGHLWRIAIAWPNAPVAPCIHRAPPSPPGAAPRLLLIS